MVELLNTMPCMVMHVHYLSNANALPMGGKKARAVAGSFGSEAAETQISRLSINRVAPSLAAVSTTSGSPAANSSRVGACRFSRLRMDT